MKIINEANYVDKADNAIKESKKQKDKKGKFIGMVTTTQIRNLLSLISAIDNDVRSFRKEDLSDSIKGRIAYLKVRFLYDAGRDQKVKNFVETAKLIDIVEEIDGKRSNFMLFSRYMEALVAYHRYYGGKDQ
ncbi:type III-A CRISPR-associated protein Csm2 [Pseudoramibacter faecis]|uniref:type III-A CRISPR-associated protein Csm2 n=1 Tax=Pseudoramibacter faecis TaxID=3108534 RepID=UPI002E78502E|nr:type III-A CRISPR-associated protein Csm2 [Pseudoramibacter sp. HA2172]